MILSSLLAFCMFVATVGPVALLIAAVAEPRLGVAAPSEPAPAAGDRLARDVELEVRRRLYGERGDAPTVTPVAGRQYVEQGASAYPACGGGIVAQLVPAPLSIRPSEAWAT